MTILYSRKQRTFTNNKQNTTNQKNQVKKKSLFCCCWGKKEEEEEEEDKENFPSNVIDSTIMQSPGLSSIIQKRKSISTSPIAMSYGMFLLVLIQGCLVVDPGMGNFIESLKKSGHSNVSSYSWNAPEENSYLH